MTIPFFSAGFRPMFLGAAVWAVLSMLVWGLYWSGHIAWEPAQNMGWEPLEWHVHELLFGYGSAVLCGFLLTAIPTWTGRPPVAGWTLAGLFALWLLGRVALLGGFPLPSVPTIDLDLAPPLDLPLDLTLDLAMIVPLFLTLTFPLAFTLIAGHEVVKGGTRRNLPVIILCVIYALANLLFVLGTQATPALPPALNSGLGARMGLAVLIMLISLIGGRIVPLFTRNWIKRHQITAPLPPEFGPGDAAILMCSTAGLFLWCALPDHPATGTAMIALGLGHLWRMQRWQGLRTLRDPLLGGLHLGYGFVPLGFVLTGGAAFLPIDPLAGIHAWTTGAIGTMTLTVMARASLGHSGRALTSGPAEWFYLYACVASGLCRILSTFGDLFLSLLQLSALLWILAFASFALRFLPVMLRPRLDSSSAP